jgi:hypothetical protein
MFGWAVLAVSVGQRTCQRQLHGLLSCCLTMPVQRSRHHCAPCLTYARTFMPPPSIASTLRPRPRMAGWPRAMRTCSFWPAAAAAAAAAAAVCGGRSVVSCDKHWGEGCSLRALDSTANQRPTQHGQQADGLKLDRVLHSHQLRAVPGRLQESGRWRRSSCCSAVSSLAACCTCKRITGSCGRCCGPCCRCHGAGGRQHARFARAVAAARACCCCHRERPAAAVRHLCHRGELRRAGCCCLATSTVASAALHGHGGGPNTGCCPTW